MELDQQTLNGAADSSTAAAADTGAGLVIPSEAGGQTETGQQPAEDPDKLLPFHTHPRWQEMRARAEEAKTYEPYKPMIEALRASGFNSFEEFQANLAEQTQRQAAETAAKAEADAIASRIQQEAVGLQQRINRNEITVQEAEAQFADRQRAIQNESELNRLKSQFFDSQIGALQTKYPSMDTEWVRVVAPANPGRTLEEIAKASHARELKREQDVIARHTATVQRNANATKQTPAGGAGGGAAVAGDMPDFGKMTQAEFQTYWDSMMQKQ